MTRQRTSTFQDCQNNTTFFVGDGLKTGTYSSSSHKEPKGKPWLPSQLMPLEEEEAANGKPAGKLRKKKEVREYTFGEEIANSITHGIGALLAIAALPILCVIAARDGGGVYLFAGLVYTITMILEYTMSTLYHAMAAPRAKKVFKILDHSCIYLFIAGTYTPVCLITLGSSGGLWLCIFVWAVALIGVATEAFWVFRPRWLSAVLYLLLGWSVVWFVPVLIELMPTPGLWLFFMGGICYTVGCIFYVLKKIRYMHSIFHVLVLAGSICHFLAIAFYIF